MAERYENTFVREVKEKNITKPEDILNWYRNLYHTEDNHTEHGIVAYAINDFFADVVPKSEVERLQEEANRYKRYFFRHDYDEMISEVLDELDRFINSNCIEIKDERGIKGYVTSGVHFAIAELKKKYTEGEE